MSYKSGRTLDQGMRRCVIEGCSLYVHPRSFSKMWQITVKGFNPDMEAREALEAAGVLPKEIDDALGHGFDIVIDYELRE